MNMNPSVPKSSEETFVAFLFDADHDFFSHSFIYGSPCEEQFLCALSESDTKHEIIARIRRGDILARNIASELSRVVLTPRPSKPTAGGWTSQSMEYRINQKTLATVVGDMVDTAEGIWSTVNLTHLAYKLASTNVYCLSVSPITLHLAKNIDRKLNQFTPYLGAIELDNKNPLHIKLFSNLLDCIYIDGETLYVSQWDTGEGAYEFGLKAESYFNLVELTYIDFLRNAPPFPKFENLSIRGAISKNKLLSVTKESHFEKVANELMLLNMKSDANLHVDLKLLPPDEKQLEVPVGKLLNYALNEEHKIGKHKARLFSELLEIRASQWRYLAYQIVEEMKDAGLKNIRVTEHGIQYEAFLQIAGLNGKTCTVKTAWIIHTEKPAQLVTAFPASKGEQILGDRVPPPFILLEENNCLRWEKIFNAATHAGKEAAITCIPCPTQVEGFGIELEGTCGGALVRLNSCSFTNWLISNGHAYKISDSDVEIPAIHNSQSVDRAEAYAKAFSRVLWLNGIDGTSVQLYLN